MWNCHIIWIVALLDCHVVTKNTIALMIICVNCILVNYFPM